MVLNTLIVAPYKACGGRVRTCDLPVNSRVHLPTELLRIGCGGRGRTCTVLIQSQVDYQLSYPAMGTV